MWPVQQGALHTHEAVPGAQLSQEALGLLSQLSRCQAHRLGNPSKVSTATLMLLPAARGTVHTTALSASKGKETIIDV